ncbi:MAG: hypothetical protein IRZ03_14530 [Acidobacterium ailaaui]|nr:hypothetical protein [Pseudacidobacterium ailaaui]
MAGDGLKLDFIDFLAHLDRKEAAVLKAEHDALEDATDDLLRISSNIAPIDTGQLRRSGRKEITMRGAGHELVGHVYFSATEESGKYGRFNYALWTHEMDYNLGPVSRQAPGVDGYEVGNKYLERPLRGESRKYLRWVAEEIGKVMDD